MRRDIEMTLNGWKRTDYDERFEMLYSSVIGQNSSWSQMALSLTRSDRRVQNDSGLSPSGGSPAPERRSRCARRQEAKSGHARSPSVQQRASRSRDRPDRGLWEHGRAGGEGPEPRGRVRWWGKAVRAGGCSENSVVISDEGTDLEALEDVGGMGGLPVDDADGDTLWAWTGGFPDREHEAQDREPDIALPSAEQAVVKVEEGAGEADCSSDCLSTASGPTFSADFTLQPPCPACAELLKKVRKLKHKEKSFDNNPVSLSCDQWVLMKIRRPRILPKRKGKLWVHLKRIRKGALNSIEAGETQKPKTSCPRPHVFLHRNLSLCKRNKAPAHRKSRDARTTARSRRRSSPVRAREGRRQKKRKLCEMETRWEEPQKKEEEEEEEEGRLHAHCASSSSSSSCRGEEAALNASGPADRNAACRKLEFSGLSATPGPPGQLEKNPPVQKPSRHDVERDAGRSPLTSAISRRSKRFQPTPEGGAAGHCPWGRNRDFRSMLAELERNRTMVVQELDHSSAN